MKRSITALIFLICLFYFPTLTQARDKNAELLKKPIIYIEGFKNLGTGKNSIGETLKRSLKLVIGLTKKYEVVTPENLQAYLANNAITNTEAKEINLSYIQANYRDLGFDEVLYGSFRPERNGDWVNIKVSVLSLLSNINTFDKSYGSPTDADIFDTVDKIGLDLATVLVGKHLGVGVLIAATTVRDSDIYVDGVKSGKGRVEYESAIAGLTHTVEVKNKEGKVLFSKEILIGEKTTYDLTYNYQEFVEVINETNTNRMTKSGYRDMKYRSAFYFRTGPAVQIGGGNFLWGGWFLDYENLSTELDLTVVPRMANYSYDWYLGMKLLFAFHVFRPDSPLFNCLNFYIKTGLIDYYGLELGFPDYSPYLYMGFGISIRPDWDFIPAFMRNWVFTIEMGTEQDLGILWKSFSIPEKGLENNNFYKNLGGPMLTFSLKF